MAIALLLHVSYHGKQVESVDDVANTNTALVACPADEEIEREFPPPRCYKETQLESGYLWPRKNSQYHGSIYPRRALMPNLSMDLNTNNEIPLSKEPQQSRVAIGEEAGSVVSEYSASEHTLPSVAEPSEETPAVANSASSDLDINEVPSSKEIPQSTVAVREEHDVAFEDCTASSMHATSTSINTDTNNEIPWSRNSQQSLFALDEEHSVASEDSGSEKLTSSIPESRAETPATQYDDDEVCPASPLSSVSSASSLSWTDFRDRDVYHDMGKGCNVDDAEAKLEKSLVMTEHQEPGSPNSLILPLSKVHVVPLDKPCGCSCSVCDDMGNKGLFNTEHLYYHKSQSSKEDIPLTTLLAQLDLTSIEDDGLEEDLAAIWIEQDEERASASCENLPSAESLTTGSQMNGQRKPDNTEMAGTADGLTGHASFGGIQVSINTAENEIVVSGMEDPLEDARSVFVEEQLQAQQHTSFDAQEVTMVDPTFCVEVSMALEDPQASASATSPTETSSTSSLTDQAMIDVSKTKKQSKAAQLASSGPRNEIRRSKPCPLRSDRKPNPLSKTCVPEPVTSDIDMIPTADKSANVSQEISQLNQRSTEKKTSGVFANIMPNTLVPAPMLVPADQHLSGTQCSSYTNNSTSISYPATSEASTSVAQPTLTASPKVATFNGTHGITSSSSARQPNWVTALCADAYNERPVPNATPTAVKRKPAIDDDGREFSKIHRVDPRSTNVLDNDRITHFLHWHKSFPAEYGFSPTGIETEMVITQA